MIYQVFSVRDVKAAAFALPFFLPRAEVAIRSFRDAIRDPKHEMSRHPEDYSLYLLGEFDDATGKMTNAVDPTLIARAEPQSSSQLPDLSALDRQEDHINGAY